MCDYSRVVVVVVVVVLVMVVVGGGAGDYLKSLHTQKRNFHRTFEKLQNFRNFRTFKSNNTGG